MSENARIRTLTLVKLAATIVVAGALRAGLLLPWVGGTGLVARNSASLLDALPSALTDQTPAGNTRVLAADGTPITYFYNHNRLPVHPDQIADVMKQALVDIEDSRFYDHNGLDIQGTLRALLTNVAAGTVREGGSTLTQQLVKQTLLETATTPEEQAAATEESVARKLREARLALALEEKYTKDEILTRYLNIVYFGHGAYGIEAASRIYFSVHAADLTLPQATMLAGLVQSPANDDPAVGDPDRLRPPDPGRDLRLHVRGPPRDDAVPPAFPVRVAVGGPRRAGADLARLPRPEVAAAGRPAAGLLHLVRRGAVRTRVVPRGQLDLLRRSDRADRVSPVHPRRPGDPGVAPPSQPTAR